MSAPAGPVRTASRERVQTFRAELSKLVTLPAIWWTVGVTWVITLASGGAFAVADRRGSDSATVSSLDAGLSPIPYAQAGLLVLGVLAVTAEHTGGQLRITLTAMPRRVTQRLVATAALSLVAIPTAMGVLVSNVVLAHLILGEDARAIELSRAIGTVVGTVGYLTLTTVLASAIGVLLRHSLAAVAVVLGYFVLLGPLVRDYLPGIARYLPDATGHAISQSDGGGDGGLGPLASWAVVLAWTITAVAASLAVRHRRDV